MKTQVQVFAEQSVAVLIGVEHAVVGKAVEEFESGIVGEPLVGIDIIAIIALIEMLMPLIMELIESCPANDLRVRENIQRPRLIQRAQFRMLVNRACRQGERRWRRSSWDISSIMIQLASEADDATVDAVIDEVRNGTMAAA